MQPAGGVIRGGHEFSAGNEQRLLPFLILRRNRPARFEHGGVTLIGGGNVREFGAGVLDAAQPQPANGGIEQMGIRRLQMFHARILTPAHQIETAKCANRAKIILRPRDSRFNFRRNRAGLFPRGSL